MAILIPEEVHSESELVRNKVNLLCYFTCIYYFTLYEVQSQKNTFTCNEVHLRYTFENETQY